jgi:hypothetical protein
MASHTQLHTEVLSLLRQHGSFRDQRHMMMLASMVAAMTLSETVAPTVSKVVRSVRAVNQGAHRRP